MWLRKWAEERGGEGRKWEGGEERGGTEEKIEKMPLYMKGRGGVNPLLKFSIWCNNVDFMLKPKVKYCLSYKFEV